MALAVITGASSGIGAALAPRLAARGYDLLLVARREDRLRELAAGLGAKVAILPLDLQLPAAPQRLLEQAGPTLELLVNNAGFGRSGRAIDDRVESQLGIIDLNVRALTELTLRAAHAMVARGRGQIINVASIVGFLPVPRLAVYAASKAYVLSFSEALDEELRATGVRIKALCPGATASEFHEVAGRGVGGMARPERLTMSAEAVADATLALIDGPARIAIPGLWNRLVTMAPRLLPRDLMTRLSARATPARGSA